MTGSEEQPVSSAYYISMILISRLSESYLIASQSPQHSPVHTVHRTASAHNGTVTDLKFCLPTLLLQPASSREMSQILITKIISFKCLLSLSGLPSPHLLPASLEANCAENFNLKTNRKQKNKIWQQNARAELLFLF